MPVSYTHLDVYKRQDVEYNGWAKIVTREPLGTAHRKISKMFIA